MDASSNGASANGAARRSPPRRPHRFGGGVCGRRFGGVFVAAVDIGAAASGISSVPPGGVQPEAQMTGSKRLMLALPCALIACASAVILGSPASGQDLQERLNETQEELSETKEKAGFHHLISHESAQIDRLAAEVADLRNKAAAAAAELAQKQAELDQAKARLAYLRQRLRESIALLEERLVAIYQSNEPDLITVILQSDGFDDLLARTDGPKAPRSGQRDRCPGPRATGRDAGHRQHHPRGRACDRRARPSSMPPRAELKSRVARFELPTRGESSTRRSRTSSRQERLSTSHRDLGDRRAARPELQRPSLPGRSGRVGAD